MGSGELERKRLEGIAKSQKARGKKQEEVRSY
jgi:hypothetical protein